MAEILPTRRKTLLNQYNGADALARACLFVWGFTPHSRSFHSYGDVTITGEVMQILTYTRHS